MISRTGRLRHEISLIIIIIQHITESLIDKPIIRNSLICKLINVQANINENNEKIINNFDNKSLIIIYPKVPNSRIIVLILLVKDI